MSSRKITRALEPAAVAIMLALIILLPASGILQSQFTIINTGTISVPTPTPTPTPSPTPTPTPTPSPTPTPTPTPTPPPGALTALHVDGRYIKDVDGNIVNLRGVNAGGFGDTACGWFRTSWSESTVRSNFQAMQNWGINSVRIMGTIRWWVENSRDSISGTNVCTMSHRDAIKRTIEIAAEYNIYVIFSFWCIDTTYAASAGGLPFDPYTIGGQPYAIMRNANDFVELWGGNSATSSSLARFSSYPNNNGQAPPSVSEALGGYSNVVYELFNEPTGADSAWTSATAACIDAIRARGDNTPVMVQLGYCGSFLGYNGHFLTLLNTVKTRTNVIASNHIYEQRGSLPYYSGGVPSMRSALGGSNDPYFGMYYVLQNLNMPVIIGEFGEGSTTFWSDLLTVLNEENVGWNGWEWRSGSIYSGSFSPTSTGQVLQQHT